MPSAGPRGSNGERRVAFEGEGFRLSWAPEGRARDYSRGASLGTHRRASVEEMKLDFLTGRRERNMKYSLGKSVNGEPGEGCFCGTRNLLLPKIGAVKWTARQRKSYRATRHRHLPAEVSRAPCFMVSL